MLVVDFMRLYGWCCPAWLGFALCSCNATTWAPEALAYRQPPARVEPYQPNRPRLVFEPRDPGIKLKASGIEVRLRDARNPKTVQQSSLPALTLASSMTRVEVCLPAALDERMATRVALLTEGAGAALVLEGQVIHLTVWREGSSRQILTEVIWQLSEPSLGPIYGGTTHGGYELTGPAYDGAELEEAHVATLLDALDAFLAQREVIEVANGRLAALQGRAPVQQL